MAAACRAVAEWAGWICKKDGRARRAGDCHALRSSFRKRGMPPGFMDRLRPGGIDGLSIIGKLRDLGKTTSVLIVSALTSTEESALAQVQQQLPPLEKELEQTRDLLRVLVGNAPDHDLPEKFELSALHLPEDLPVSLPSKVAAGGTAGSLPLPIRPHAAETRHDDSAFSYSDRGHHVGPDTGRSTCHGRWATGHFASPGACLVGAACARCNAMTGHKSYKICALAAQAETFVPSRLLRSMHG
jgi:hypothetical protein